MRAGANYVHTRACVEERDGHTYNDAAELAKALGNYVCVCTVRPCVNVSTRQSCLF